MNMNELIVSKDYEEGIEQALANNPGLANEGFSL